MSDILSDETRAATHLWAACRALELATLRRRVACVSTLECDACGAAAAENRRDKTADPATRAEAARYALAVLTDGRRQWGAALCPRCAYTVRRGPLTGRMMRAPARFVASIPRDSPL